MKAITILAIIMASLILIILALATVVSFEHTTSLIKSKIIKSTVEEMPGQAPENTYPLILLHGFDPTYSKSVAGYHMKDLQEGLVEELKYVDKGILTSETTCTELQYSQNPIVIRTTYFETFQIGKIQDHSKNLGQIINKITTCTGAEKIDIIAHSMGGIASRHYIKNNENPKIRKLIMIATPNHGGLYGAADLTEILVTNGKSVIDLDFIELSENHDFMQYLNQDNWETNTQVEYYTIAGNKDGKGDGVILEKSVELPEISMHNTVPCGHMKIKDPSNCPESFELIKQALNSEI
jgi:uncharacterized alpha/beta hydrolase family protein